MLSHQLTFKTTMSQTTLNNRISLTGQGLHTGKQVTVTLCPAPVNNGILFRRIDLNPPVDIPAQANKVCSTARGTTLKEGKASISTIEHLMSALHGMAVDNVIIETNGEEIPILDGSALRWVEAIRQAGIVATDTSRRYFIIDKPFDFTIDSSVYHAEPADDFAVNCIIDFHSNVLGRQESTLDTFDNYAEQVAPCRTFVFLHEISTLLALGLIKGGSLENALVYVDRPLGPIVKHNLAKHYGMNPDDIAVKNGVLNTQQPIFENEPARHKMLDFIGDIRLVGAPIRGHFTIQYPGHHANTLFAQKLIEKYNFSTLSQ